MSKVRVTGSWRTAANGYVKVNGVWRMVVASHVKINGSWRIGTLGQPPATPVMSHTAYGQFTITNHDPRAVYTLTRVSGAGTASRSGAVVTLSDPNARFSIVASFAPGAPASGTAFMERKAYTFTLVNRPYPCGTHQCNCRQEWGSCGCGTCDNFPAPNSQSWGQCGCTGPVWDMCWYNPTTVCDSCTSYCDNWVNEKNPTPSGFVDKHGEWSRVA